jgi:serine/threonine protein kinase
MEYAFGGELYHRLQTVHKFSEAEARFYFCEIASALRYLHLDLGWVYRYDAFLYFFFLLLNGLIVTIIVSSLHFIIVIVICCCCHLHFAVI